ncbi:mpv17-like protein 2 [Agrilus planipennis]|uniref:Mpv17-like protein 2 n=1 Tax=Agrilus planipennis TaxID=224129 RepID=A0A1W4XHK5_AGRPL|nr:mpv17-like protein 2 [Agrilus planipennis]
MSFKKMIGVLKIGPIQRNFNKAFGKYLLATNTISCGVLMLGGDIIQQEIEYRQGKLKKRYNWLRVGQMFIVGLSQGPLHHYFYGWMDKILPRRNLQSVISKICLDQIIMSPVCIVEFFYCLGYLELKSTKECTKELKDKFIEVYTMDWCVWPPTQFINFLYVPVKYQVLYINGVTTLYNVFLSYIKHREMVSTELTAQKHQSREISSSVST